MLPRLHKVARCANRFVHTYTYIRAQTPCALVPRSAYMHAHTYATIRIAEKCGESIRSDETLLIAMQKEMNNDTDIQ